MNPARRLVDDLVRKRLWPVALVLVIAAIAVPVIIAGSGGDAASDVPDPAFALAPGSAAATSPALELAGPPAVRSRRGAVRDPFRRSKSQLASATSSSSATIAKTASTTSKSTRSGATSSGSKATTTSATKTTAVKPKSTPAVDPAIAIAARSIYQTAVRFTRAGGTRSRPLARLAVLGNSANPALQYLGVSNDGRYAIFVLGPKATATGDDGACVVADPCRAIGLRKGEKLGVDVVADGLAVRRYEVEVTELRRLRMSSAARARAWRARVDPDGYAVRKLLAQDSATDGVLDRLRFSVATGKVKLTP